jgi:hypothetical protein
MLNALSHTRLSVLLNSSSRSKTCKTRNKACGTGLTGGLTGWRKAMVPVRGAAITRQPNGSTSPHLRTERLRG